MKGILGENFDSSSKNISKDKEENYYLFGSDSKKILKENQMDYFKDSKFTLCQESIDKNLKTKKMSVRIF